MKIKELNESTVSAIKDKVNEIITELNRRGSEKDIKHDNFLRRRNNETVNYTIRHRANSRMA